MPRNPSPSPVPTTAAADRPCRACSGTGQVTNGQSGRRQPCPSCRGAGRL